MALLDFLRRGQPAPLGPDQRQRPPYSDFPLAPASVISLPRPSPQPGAQALAYQSYHYMLGHNPIGAGAVVQYPWQAFGSAPAHYLKGAPVFGAPTINFGRTPPSGGPLWSPGQLAAILGRYDLALAMTPAEAAGLPG